VRENCDPLLVGDQKALKNIDNTISILDGHYQMGHPWRQEDPCLPFKPSKGNLTAFFA